MSQKPSRNCSEKLVLTNFFTLGDIFGWLFVLWCREFFNKNPGASQSEGHNPPTRLSEEICRPLQGSLWGLCGALPGSRGFSEGSDPEGQGNFRRGSDPILVTLDLMEFGHVIPGLETFYPFLMPQTLENNHHESRRGSEGNGNAEARTFGSCACKALNCRRPPLTKFWASLSLQCQ